MNFQLIYRSRKDQAGRSFPSSKDSPVLVGTEEALREGQRRGALGSTGEPASTKALLEA